MTPRLDRAQILGASLLAFTLLGADAKPTATEWDSARVTELGGELAGACEAVYQAVYRQPVGAAGAGGRAGWYDLQQTLRRLRTESRALAGHLEHGQGRKETHGLYRTLMELVRDAREKGSRVMLTEDVMKQVDHARRILDQLAPFYGDEPRPR